MANNYKNAKLDLTSTNITTLYTAPAAHTGIFKSIIISNDSGSADTITLTITNSASAVFSVYNSKERCIKYYCRVIRATFGCDGE